MPEYLSPGVYIEELASGLHPIDGVSTSPPRDCLDAELLNRPSYFSGKLLTADDLSQEQDYFRAKSRRHNRWLHGWGVVCGLAVSADPTAERPWRVRIGAGMALAPSGDELIVPTAVSIDLAQHRPTSPATLFIALRHVENPTQPASGFDETTAGRTIQDGVSIGCLAAAPPSHQPAEPSLCDVIQRGGTIPCTPCEEDPWVVLAQVHLPASPHVAVGDVDIDAHSVRRVAGATAALQAQIIECCCNGKQHGGRPSLVRWIRTLFRSPSV